MNLRHREMLLFVLVALASTTAARAGALDERAPVIVQVAPREACALHLLLNGLKFKGDDQDAHARISEALGFAGIDARVREIKRDERREATFEDFSDKPAPRAVPRDDAARVLVWVRDAEVPGAFNEVLAPLVRRLRKAIEAR